LSQRSLADAAGTSPTKVSRLERGVSRDVSIRSFAILFALLGQTLTLRAYPHGSPLRDAAQIRLLRRFVALLASPIRFVAEVPLHRPGDLRAWDGELRAGRRTCKIEAETLIADAQALERRIALKMADDGVSVVILLVADTRRNRAALRDAGDVLKGRFPLGTRDVLAELRAGRLPTASGMVVL
jgi:transcriptional regulator with XRE-family HTH domain